MKLPFIVIIDSDLLYTDALYSHYRQWFVLYRCPLRQVWLYLIVIMSFC